jgi:hypothetical protein
VDEQAGGGLCALDDAVHDEERLVAKGVAQAGVDGGFDDEVEQTGFVFEVEEEDAVGGLGTLADDDQTDHLDALAGSGFLDLPGGEDAGLMQGEAAMVQDVGTGGEAEELIVPDGLFEGG